MVAEPDETLFAFISGFAWLFICFNKERIELLIESSEFEGFFFLVLFIFIRILVVFDGDAMRVS